jgi:CheY-like chemotaxis protein
MKTKIVVVDDNANNLLLEKDLLIVAGFEVYTAVNASDAMQLIKEVKPHVIVLDVQLPDISGSELARVLRFNKETITTPIVFVTASVLQSDIDHLLCIPNSAYISKPINTRTFSKEVSQCIK